ncbi:MAG TPA: hemolysin family protein [Usitatibacter sp.]|jgi:putative hemolysin|nr:hemolysin family protein [Usitatibacter sp.]
MEILILFTLILLNGVFAMSEIAIVTSRKARMQKFVDAGDAGALAAVEVGQEPTDFLSTVQIGITSISILNGIVGESVLAEPLSRWLQGHFPLDQDVARYLGTGLVVVGITYFSIVLGELVPKRLGQINPEAVARVVARPMLWLAVISKPFVKLLAGSTNLVLRILGAHDAVAPTVTEDEIHAMLVEGKDAGVIEHHEHAMMRNVFRLDDRQLGSLMVPRSDIVFLDPDRSLEDNIKRVEESSHARYPVARHGGQEILGIISAREVLIKTLHHEVPDLRSGLLPPVYVPETLTGMELLGNFRDNGSQLAFVVDEYGEVLGMVTLRDLMEAIIGEFKPRNVEDAWAVRRDDGSWLLDGLIPIPELKDRLELKEVPEEDKGRYHTLAGMLMYLLGRLPHTGDHATWANWKLEVVDMDGKRIDKVLAMRQIQSEPDPKQEKA